MKEGAGRCWSPPLFRQLLTALELRDLVEFQMLHSKENRDAPGLFKMAAAFPSTAMRGS